MTDTDKLKRLAEDKRFGGQYMPVEKTDILALIAENERLRECANARAGLSKQDMTSPSWTLNRTSEAAVSR